MTKPYKMVDGHMVPAGYNPMQAEDAYWTRMEAEEWLDHCAGHDLFVDWDAPEVPF